MQNMLKCNMLNCKVSKMHTCQNVTMQNVLECKSCQNAHMLKSKTFQIAKCNHAKCNHTKCKCKLCQVLKHVGKVLNEQATAKILLKEGTARERQQNVCSVQTFQKPPSRTLVMHAKGLQFTSAENLQTTSN